MADTYTPTITGGVTMGGTATTYYIGDAVYIGGENRGFVNSSGYHPTDTTNMTVMFWLQFNSLQSTQWRTMWTYYPRWDASQPLWWIGCSQKTGDNPITPNVRIVAEDGSLNYIYIASGTSYWNYPQGVWHHVCYVKTGIAHFLYIDGVEIDTQELAQPSVTDWSDIDEAMIGAYTGEQGQWSMAYFRQWSRALTVSQIRREMTRRRAQVRTDLFLELNLTTVDGTDLSGNGHSMTVLNGGGISVTDGPPNVMNWVSYAPVSGGMTLSGDALTLCKEHRYTGVGGMTAGGTATVARAKGYVYAATGGLRVQGTTRVITLPTCTITGSLYHPSTGAKITSGQLTLLPMTYIITQGKFINPTPVTYAIPASGDISLPIAYSQNVPYLVEFDPDPTDTYTPPSAKSGYWRNRWVIPSQSTVTITSL